MESRRHPANKAGPSLSAAVPASWGHVAAKECQPQGHAGPLPHPPLRWEEGACPPRHPLGRLFSTSDTGPEPPGWAGPPRSLAKEPPPGVG